MNKLTFFPVDNPHHHFIRSLRSAMVNDNQLVTGTINTKHLGICINDDSQNTVGAIYGWIEWGWLYIDLLWVDEIFRSQGLATQLLEQLENTALEYNIDRVYLDTGSFQAPGFYKKRGYEIYAELEIIADDGKDYIKYSMRKPSILKWRKENIN